MNDNNDETQRKIFANFAKLKKETTNNSNSNDAAAAREQLALETALLIEQEVERWKASVAELEAALDGHHAPAANVVFPSIPAIVDADDDDDGSGGGSSSSPPVTRETTTNASITASELNDNTADEEDEVSTL